MIIVFWLVALLIAGFPPTTGIVVRMRPAIYVSPLMSVRLPCWPPGCFPWPNARAGP